MHIITLHHVFEKYILSSGESCSGKSSIINLILGEKILPIGVTASTSLVYRIKPSEQYTVSTKNFRDEEIQKMSFENWKGIADKLEVLAKVDNKYISYVDICMPVPLLNVRTLENRTSLSCNC